MDNRSVNTIGIQDGTVEVRNGQIIIKNPQGGGKQARVTPGKGLKLYIDGVEVKRDGVVFEGCKIRVDIEGRMPERNIIITIEDVNMTAYAAVTYKNGDSYKLRDKPPSNEMLLDVEYSGVAECQAYTCDEVLEALKAKGITHGIIQENIKSALLGEGRIVIAKGTEPVHAGDDQVAARYEADNEKKFVEIEDRVDFYSIGRIVSVNPGDLVAEKIPGSDGAPGTDVFGKSIKQKSGRRLKLIAGKGVCISDDGLKAYSNILGRPEIRDNVISVHEVYEIPLNVDVSTGNIEFAGDVVVKGNVMEGMKVKAGGNVRVYGNITDCEITAGGNVTVNKNIIGSKIAAGCNDILRLRIIEYLEGFVKTLKEIFSATSMLKETGKIPKTYEDGQIIKLLVDTKFKSLSKSVQDFRALVSENRESLDDNAIRLGARIIKYFLGNGPLLFNNTGELNSLAEQCSSQIAVFEGQLKDPSKIETNYIQNSNLETSGSIYVYGKGCYNSNLSCRKEVVFERPGSVMRGGSINAGGSIKIYELGSPGGAMTLVSAGKDCEITSETAYINSIVRVGNMSNRLDASVRKLKAYIYKGELMIEKSKL